MEPDLVPIDPRPPFLLLAGYPAEDDPEVSPRQTLGIEEALLSFARAAFSRGRRVVLPDAPAVTPLLALVAAEYGRPRRSEQVEEEPALLEIVGRREEGALLDFLVRLGRVSRGSPAGFADLLERTEVRTAVVIGAPAGLGEWVGLLEQREVIVRSVEWLLSDRSRRDARSAGSEPEVWGVGRQLLERIGWGRGGEEEEERAALGAETVVPYPYLMQRLVEMDEGEGAPLMEGERFGAH